MWRFLYKILKFFWWFLLSVLGAGILVSLLNDIIRGKSITFAPWLVHSVQRAGTRIILLGASILAGLVILTGLSYFISFRQRRQEKARQAFNLYKSTQTLNPTDLGFQTIQVGEKPDLKRRPFHLKYIPRKIVPYDKIGNENPHPIYTDEALTQMLREGQGFVLLGQPAEGKTRTLYEVIKSLKGYFVVSPIKDRPVPSDKAFAGLRRKKVILLLEDLNDWATASVDILEFCRKLQRNTRIWGVAGTCRDGSELSSVREALGSGLKRFYENIPSKLGFIPITKEEKQELAKSIGKTLIGEESDFIPTPGSITMADSFKDMLERFQALPPEQKDILRALKLLALAGVLPFTHRRLQAILKHLFQRHHFHLGDCLDALTEQAFLRRPKRQDPVFPEPAYLLKVVVNGENDFSDLADVFKNIRDFDGLFLLGITYGSVFKDYMKALICFEDALSYKADFFEAWNNKGAALENLGRYEEALAAYDKALEINPEYANAWYNKGVALRDLGRYEEALAAYDKALEIDPEHIKAWYNKGVDLGNLGRYEEALEACDKTLEINPDFHKPYF